MTRGQKKCFSITLAALLYPFPVNSSPKPPEAFLNSTKIILSELLVVLEVYVNKIILFGFFGLE